MTEKKRPGEKPGAFVRWVSSIGGAQVLARSLGMTEPGVTRWLRKECQPNTRTAVRMIVMGRGAFDYNDLVRDTYRGKLW
jgi:hypothetical protein